MQPLHDIPPGWVEFRAIHQQSEGPLKHLRGEASVETSDAFLKADEIDYNEDTGDAEARGNVYLLHYAGGEELWADRADYNADQETGKFYNVRGKSPVHIEAKPGVLTSSSPFYFQGKWAERLQDKYVLHDGFITNCKTPNPWWILRGPKFDVVPNERAIAYRTVFWLHDKFPLFYSPFFYKSLERLPRKSGFLTPNIGNSSQRGKMLGAGYYWAINRSYDAMYRAQYFTQRGLAHTVDFRGKPREKTDFNVYLYGVSDKEGHGGFSLAAQGRSDLGHGFYARGELGYLSSLDFRQTFTESFTEAIASEVRSVGFIRKDWQTYGLNFVFQRNENFQSIQPNDTIVIRKLPEVEFSSRDRQIWSDLPIWISWDSSAGLLRRSQLLFQTRQFLERIDFYPRIMTALRWKDFSLLPSFAVRESHYGESEQNGKIVGQNINRSAREFSVALVPPSLERIYKSPKWLGDKIKHVIEPRISYLYVTGVDNFNELIRFDGTELYSNTNEAEISLTNRLYVKRHDTVDEVLSWEVSQRRYFDPTFGGAVVAGQRNEVLSALDVTPYAFLDGPRTYSPVVSVLRLTPKPGFGIEWRSDYDPLRNKFVNSGLTADARFGSYFFSVGHTNVSAVPLLRPGQLPFDGNACQAGVQGQVHLLSPCTNQLRTLFGFGEPNKRGWNAAFSEIYDFRVGAMQFATVQVAYNTDCCGFSIQYHRFSFGTRNENQFRVAFAVANVGSFGTLKKQEKMF